MSINSGTQRQKRRLMVRLEQSFFAIGFALLAVWGVAAFDSIFFSHAALAKFETDHTIKATAIPALHDLAYRSQVDFASWSSKRIESYKDSFLQKVDPPLAVLRIPRIHLHVPVFNGTDDVTLNRGAGRIAGTAQVGADGNLGIAGHRDGFFRGLKDVAQGDVIELARPGATDLYVIDSIQIVSPEDVSVLSSTPAPSLTLVTCFPFYFVGSAPQRYIVRASFKSSSQSRAGASNGSVFGGNNN
jgi:sortase A